MHLPAVVGKLQPFQMANLDPAPELDCRSARIFSDCANRAYVQRIVRNEIQDIERAQVGSIDIGLDSWTPPLAHGT